MGQDAPGIYTHSIEYGRVLRYCFGNS